MFNEILKKRYEVLLRQRSQRISALQKLVLQQEEELANKEIAILNLEDEIKKLKTPSVSTKKKTRQRKQRVSVENTEETNDDQSNSN